MKANKLIRVFFIFIFFLALAVPTRLAFASKTVYKASLSSANELHAVTGSSARGSALVSVALDGTYSFVVFVRGLSGPATAAHIHGPANATQTAPVLIGLCGPSSILATCTMDANGNLSISGSIGPGALQAGGITGAQFKSYLEDGLLYVNVHTALNPAGEARGQLIAQ